MHAYIHKFINCISFTRMKSSLHATKFVYLPVNMEFYFQGMWAHKMTCGDYETLLDRGWRRFVFEIVIRQILPNIAKNNKTFNWVKRTDPLSFMIRY